MIQALLLLGLTGGALATHIDKAHAVVCARGIYRAGCVGPYGGVVVHRPFAPHYGAPYRGGYYRGGYRGGVVIRR